IVFPETAKADAARIAERLRQRVREAAVTLPDGRKLGVTVSLGVATYPDDAEDMRGLVAEADKALYAAKEGGRDRVVVCTGTAGAKTPAAPGSGGDPGTGGAVPGARRGAGAGGEV
ncbi:MAG: GGDEF domain-containing protein, partial [Planctomycetales bacterium]|nr:GGDEF domain-containing protein [Planctomycetales bacterium]